MLSSELSNHIRQLAKELCPEELLAQLQELERSDALELNQDSWDYAIDFAKYLVCKMQEALDHDQWYGYEVKALKALEDIPCREYELVEINTYGFPVRLTDNDRLLELLGIADKLCEEVAND